MYRSLVDKKLDKYKNKFFVDLVYSNTIENTQALTGKKGIDFEAVLKKKDGTSQQGKPIFSMKIFLGEKFLQIKNIKPISVLSFNPAYKELLFYLFLYYLKEDIMEKYDKKGLIVSSGDHIIQNALLDNGFKIKTSKTDETENKYSGMWRLEM